MLKFFDGENITELSPVSIQRTTMFHLGASREAMCFTFNDVPFETIQNVFKDDAQYIEENTYYDENNQVCVSSRDFSNYCIVGNITAYRNGAISVTMGEKSGSELEIERLRDRLNENYILLDEMQKAYTEGVQEV